MIKVLIKENKLSEREKYLMQEIERLSTNMKHVYVQISRDVVNGYLPKDKLQAKINQANKNTLEYVKMLEDLLKEL